MQTVSQSTPKQHPAAPSPLRSEKETPKTNETRAPHEPETPLPMDSDRPKHDRAALVRLPQLARLLDCGLGRGGRDGEVRLSG